MRDQKPRLYELNPRGHVWRKDEDGYVDIFGLEVGNHNGPICIKCGYSFCRHCDEGPQEDCTGEES